MKAMDKKLQLKDGALGTRHGAFRKTGLLVVLALLVSPFTLQAQVDDIYFVPKKEKEKVLVVKSVTEEYYVDEDASYRDVDEYNRRSAGYTNDPELYIEENCSDDDYYYADEYNDYDYSTRIIRFRNPQRAVGSAIYWDLNYGCGINDWLVVDNGYSIDIYPTVNNPLYLLNTASYVWNSINYYNWRDWYNRYYWDYTHYWNYHYPYYHRYYDYCHYGTHYHNHWYGHHYDNYHRSLWRPSRNYAHIPSNGAVSGGRRHAGNGKPYSNTAGRGDRGGRVDRGKNGGVDLRGVNRKGDGKDRNVASDNRGGKKDRDNNRMANRGSNNTKVRNERAQDGNVRELRIGGRAEKVNGKGSGNPGSQNGRNGTVNNGRTRNKSVNGSNGTVGADRNGGRQERGTVRRNNSSSSSTDRYNRPSSTSVTRSRNSGSNSRSSGSNYSSGRSRSSSGSSYSGSSSRSSSRSSGSSYSSGSSRSSSRNSGSSYSSGSSRSSSSYSSGGGSRSGGGGGSRSGGSSRGGGGGRGR